MYCNHCSSHDKEANALYSASVEDLETVFCFLDFQQTREEPMRIQKPVTDLLVSGHLAQSESAKAEILRALEAE